MLEHSINNFGIQGLPTAPASIRAAHDCSLSRRDENPNASLGIVRSIGNKEHRVFRHLVQAIEIKAFSPCGSARAQTEHKRSTALISRLPLEAKGTVDAHD